MNEERCVICGSLIPEGRQVCWICEHDIVKIGSILQSHNAAEDDVIKAHKFINKGIKFSRVDYKDSKNDTNENIESGFWDNEN